MTSDPAERSGATDSHEHGAPPSTAADWDARYRDAEQVWSGDPNGALVAEAADLPPGRALDVGCGESADAVWLARQGWLHAGMLEAALDGPFDLVSAQYPALLRTPDAEAERALLASVAPGGILLFVHHEDLDGGHAEAHAFDLADYVQPPDVAALLDDSWQIEVEERRPRHVATGAGSGHTHDLVLRARRLR